MTDNGKQMTASLEVTDENRSLQLIQQIHRNVKDYKEAKGNFKFNWAYVMLLTEHCITMHKTES